MRRNRCTAKVAMALGRTARATTVICCGPESLVTGVESATMTTSATNSRAVAMTTSRTGLRVTIGSRPKPTATLEVA
jgi:hypothetical protein